MIVLFLGVIGAFALALLLKLLWGNSRTKTNSKIVITATVVLVGVLGMLAASGRMHWLMAMGTAALPFARRAFMALRFIPWISQLSRLAGAGFGNPFAADGSASNGTSSSETSTSELHMQLDHNSGNIDGDVLRGSFANRKLSALNDSEIIDLYENLAEEESKRLVESYIARHRPHMASSEHTEQDQSSSDGNMTPQRAADILGVELNATKEEIVAAHRRLVQHLHPDKGGSSFLTAELNEAKRVLLAAS